VVQLTCTAGRRERVSHGADERGDENLLPYLGMEMLGNLAQTHSGVGPDATLQPERSHTDAVNYLSHHLQHAPHLVILGLQPGKVA
jgi:hypothetical protein